MSDGPEVSVLLYRRLYRTLNHGCSQKRNGERILPKRQDWSWELEYKEFEETLARMGVVKLQAEDADIEQDSSYANQSYVIITNMLR